MMRSLVLGLVLCATPALAHLAKIVPSTCALSVGLAAPEAGLTATVDAPGTGDLLRVSYEPDASPDRSRVLACPADPVDPAGRCGAAVPRGFTLGASSGTITLPAAFAMRMLSSGDLAATGVPITITLDGTAVAVPFDLTTGFLVVGDTPVVGEPIDANGAVALVGTGASAALPAPLGGAVLRLDLACALAPAPDLDQFALAPRVTKARGVFTAKSAKLVVQVESETSTTFDPASYPAIVRLGAPGAALMDLLVPLAVAPHGRFASPDGTIMVIPLAKKTVRAQKIVFKRKPGVAVPPFTSGEDDLAVSLGGLTARRGVTLKANGRGTRLVVRER